MDKDFVAFPKIARLNREIVITEKIDGTNASIYVSEKDGAVYAGSRTRWITPEDDNFGFARWVRDHADELRTGLGFGVHFGEWWGAGIQRRYGLTPHAYHLNLRVNEAKARLARGEDLATVAQECGFCDQGHFTRVFARCVGMTPGAYRRLVAGSAPSGG